MWADDLVLEAIAQFLRGIPGLEQNVTLDEERIPEQPDAPWCWIQPGDFSITGGTLGPAGVGKKYRELTVTIDLVGRGGATERGKLGQIAHLIEDRIDADPTLGRAVTAAELAGGTRARDDEAALAHIRLNYFVRYSTVRGAAGTPLS